MVDFTVYKGSKGGKIVKATGSRSIGPDEVLVKVTHSGLCFTDVHFKEADMVLGHEGTGLVQEVGSSVTLFKKYDSPCNPQHPASSEITDVLLSYRGDRVGWGYNHNCCGHCKQCLRGMDTFCPERALYGSSDLDQGSMASHAIWNQNFLFNVPDGLDSVYAAPLMCGGATVFNALHLHGVRPYDRVGIIGVGGLGHLAIQFAAKMGCTVAVFSGSDSKKEEAMKLGATEFYAVKGMKSADELNKAIKGKIEYLIVTTSQQPDWEMYQGIMESGGTICVSNSFLALRSCRRLKQHSPVRSPPSSKTSAQAPSQSSLFECCLHMLTSLTMYSRYRSPQGTSSCLTRRL